jgi:hypothetical protein
LILAFFLFKKSFAKKWVQQYWFYNFVVISLFLLNFFWLPQGIPVEILPAILVLWFRNLKMIYSKQNFSTKLKS